MSPLLFLSLVETIIVCLTSTPSSSLDVDIIGFSSSFKSNLVDMPSHKPIKTAVNVILRRIPYSNKL